MTCKKLLVVVVLLSVILGVDARSPRKTEKLYRKAGKWQRKLRDVWALLGVKPFLVQPGEEGDECVLKSKVEEDYVLKSTVEADACGSGTVLDASTMKCVVEDPVDTNQLAEGLYSQLQFEKACVCGNGCSEYGNDPDKEDTYNQWCEEQVAEDAAFFAGEGN